MEDDDDDYRWHYGHSLLTLDTTSAPIVEIGTQCTQGNSFPLDIIDGDDDDGGGDDDDRADDNGGDDADDDGGDDDDEDDDDRG